ncbi:MAG: pyruvate dehydrogenase complex dihydrolipoamide acetyltransferase [Phycisphaerales bacterium]|nr:pyruvate dehydrogenase complex dihydrolipoamide acetyltransferase [Phycisphaerales bacterium]
MPADITMPQLSDTMTEGTLVKWLVKEGDAIKAGQIVAEVETDKATMEMESFDSGTLALILIKEGEKAPVGGAIATLTKAGEKLEAAPAKPAAAAKQSTAKAEAGEAESPKNDPHAAAASSATATVSAPPAAPAATASNGHGGSNGSGERLIASPLAKRVAADLGVEIGTVKGSGPNGRIVQADVMAAAEAKKFAPAAGAKGAKPTPPPMPTRVANGQTEKVTLSKMRIAIASALQRSKQNIPHFYETIDIDMTQATSLRKKLLDMFEKKEGIRISIGDIIAKAVACALKAVPQLNSTFDEKTNTVTRFGDVNLGMAVALPDGLIVPVLRNIDQMSFKEIRIRSAELVDRARAQKLKREEMSGATFTVSNLGLMGIREFSAIVNPPEVGILAIGASEDKAVVKNGQIIVQNRMTVTLSCDHRVIDGAVAANFLVSLKGFLEEPALMLM